MCACVCVSAFVCLFLSADFLPLYTSSRRFVVSMDHMNHSSYNEGQKDSVKLGDLFLLRFIGHRTRIVNSLQWDWLNDLLHSWSRLYLRL